MIREIFLPTTVDSYYVFAQSILGIQITKTHVRATQVIAKGTTKTIKGFFEESLSTNAELTYEQRVAHALKTIVAQVDGKPQLRTALSSSLVTIKQLTLPFTDPEKIAMVLSYEIEPQLPFALDTALLDFIITSTDQTAQQSTILVAAVQKEQVAKHSAYFKAAELELAAITIDLFDIYGLYRMIPAYTARTGAVVLLDLEATSTRLLYIVNNKLERLRTIPHGMAQVAKAAAQALNIENGAALEQLLRFGIQEHEHEVYQKAVSASLTSLWQSIQFTLDSFTSQTTNGALSSILLLGSFAHIPGISTFITQQSAIACRPFEIHLLFDNPQIKTTNRTVPLSQLFSLSTALPNPISGKFNLLQQEFAPPTLGVFTARIITISILVLSILGALITFTIWQTRSLRSQISRAERAPLEQLKVEGLVDEDETSLSEAIETAQGLIEKQEEQWFAFSRHTRTPLLFTLQKLSEAIDREGIDLQLKQLEITENYITIEGKVRDFPELKIFEDELRESALFNLPLPDIPDITFGPIKLMLKKEKRGNR